MKWNPMIRRRGGRTLNERGVTLVEMLIASAILAMMVASMASIQQLLARQSVKTRDRVYASQRALQMMDELRALVATGEQQGINILDNYDQGNVLADPTGAQSVSILQNAFSPVLTTDMSVTNAASGTSANRLTGSAATPWRFTRNVYIRTPSGEVDKNVRLVTVRVFYSGDVDGVHQPTPLSEVTGVLRSVGESLVPSQAYDIYVFSIFSVPGWWVNVGKLQTTFLDVVGDITNRNPGFTPRVHYITKAAYGRDKEYAPFVNGPFTNLDTDTGWLANTTAMPFVYFYPGHMTVDSGEDYFFFWSSLFNSDGAQVRIANTTVTQMVNDVAANPSYPEHYSIADQFNHAVRYPEEVRLFNEATNAAKALYPNDPTKWPEPSLRMLLERMNSQPVSYQNALIINLGGEMLPIPTIRNYSDAAKWPDGVLNNFILSTSAGITYSPTSASPSLITNETGTHYRYGAPVSLANYRVVTHPEQIQYTPLAASPSYAAVTLRVYPYMMMADWYPNRTTLPVASVYLPNDIIPAAAITINKVVGCANDGLLASPDYGTGVPYTIVAAVLNTDYQVTNVNNGTLIRLFNTPMRCYQYTGSCGTGLYGGLGSTNRVDADLEYIPCALGTTGINFTGNNLDQCNAKPKNTTRWMIVLNLSSAVTVNPHVVETRLGDPYEWGAGNTTAYGAATQPITFYDVNENPMSAATSYTSAGVPTSYPANLPATTFSEGITTDYQNLSRTYVWVGSAPPKTEQYQIFGPAPFCPYSDTKNAGNYNWFWNVYNTSVTAQSFAGFSQAKTFVSKVGSNGVTAVGWGGAGMSYPLEFDYPRICQFYREGLLRTSAVWSTLNGYSYWDFGLGGEIGAEPQAPTANGISIVGLPWDGTTNTAVIVNEISDGGAYAGTWTGRKVMMQNNAVSMNLSYSGPATMSPAKTWHARYWLGELFPDALYATNWSKESATAPSKGGNLPTGSGANKFIRANYNNVLDMGRSVGSLAESAGPVQFLDATTTAGVNTSWFRPDNGQSTTITGLGSNLANLFNFPMPIEFVGYSTRPYQMNSTGYEPDTWSETDTANQRVVCDVPAINGVARTFYNPSDTFDPTVYDTSGIIRLKKSLALPSQTPTPFACYIADNGLPAEGETGTSLLAKIVLLTMLRAYFDAGLYTNESHIIQLPWVNMTYPGVGDSIQTTSAVSVIWNTSYLKWDGNPYTEEYPTPNPTPNSTPSYTESVSLVFGLKYATSSSGPWYWAKDGSPTWPGQVPSSGYTITSASSCVTYTWNPLALNLPDGQYYLRVEAFRAGMTLHYSYDTSKFTMKK